MTTHVAVWDISDSDSLMTANLDIEWSRPNYILDSVRFADADADSIMEPLETVQLYLYLTNLWKDASNITIGLSSNDEDISFTIPSIGIPDILGNGGSGDNIGNPLEFIVPDFDRPMYDSFYITIETYGGEQQHVFGVETVFGKADILLVDADRGGNYEEIYMADLKNLWVPADIWDKSAKGSPSAMALNEYAATFWFTCDTSSDLISPADIEAMKSYLDSGGSLFLTGQGIANELHAEDSAFLEDYLHARKGPDLFFFMHQGIVGSPIGDGLVVRYNSSNNQVLGQSQEIVVIPDAMPAFRFDIGSQNTALSYSGSYKLVYFNWGYEAISSNFTNFADRDTVLTNILIFLTDYVAPICIDSDGDGFGDPDHPENECMSDNCPNIPNEDQIDSDNDGIGDACDNCLNVVNEDQLNSDGDTFGDVCDNCTDTDNEDQANSDTDSHGDACDNCPNADNEDQINSDADSHGDACDNCPNVDNEDQTNSDTDSRGDVCDNCPDVDNEDQADTNENGVGDACDWLCGDSNSDDNINILDVTFLISYLYKEGDLPEVLEACDVNSDETINLLDCIYLISFLYKDGPAPECP
jgi:hypothetical protein